MKTQEILCNDDDMVIFKYCSRQYIGTVTHLNGPGTALLIEYDDEILEPDGTRCPIDSTVFLDDPDVTVICNLGNHAELTVNRAINKLVEL